MFHRKFPDKKLTIYRLRKVYREHGIKRKKIRNTKVITESQKKKIYGEAVEARDRLQELEAEGYRILFVDEIVTTKSTIPSHEYSAPNRPFRVDFKQFQSSCIATVAAISHEKGVDHVMNFPSSVDRHKFIQFVNQVARKNKGQKIAMFMDRLNVHRSPVVQAKMDAHGIKCIFNASYSPDYNPIEGVFAVTKNYVKRERLKAIIHRKRVQLEALILSSFKQVDKQSIQNLIFKSIN